MISNIQKVNARTYQLFENNKNLGTISTYTNVYHNSHLYLKFNLLNYPTYSPFYIIAKAEKKSLQVMLDSNEKSLIKFLTKNGFQLKRCCFSPIVSRFDLKYSIKRTLKIAKFDNHNTRYLDYCEFLYNYYKKTHAQVSPLTVSKAAFIKEISSKTGYYHLDNNHQIDNLVFTKNNEIVYICSNNKKNCGDFIQTVLTEMFDSFKNLFFDADDTDWAATILLEQFNFNKNQSYNTYIFKIMSKAH